MEITTSHIYNSDAFCLSSDSAKKIGSLIDHVYKENIDFLRSQSDRQRTQTSQKEYTLTTDQLVKAISKESELDRVRLAIKAFSKGFISTDVFCNLIDAKNQIKV